MADIVWCNVIAQLTTYYAYVCVCLCVCVYVYHIHIICALFS